jgi:osmoprotectant transport system permease protein
MDMPFMDFVVDRIDQILYLTGQHLALILSAMAVSIPLGLGLGIMASYSRWFRAVVLYLVDLVTTIPSIALFGLLIPWFGLGFPPAVIGLILYTQLPVMRNTCEGIASIDPSVLEAARGMGMPELRILYRIKLPLATATILAGIRVSVVIGVGLTTIAAYIGSGGLGEFILRGIARSDATMVLVGASLVSVLAIVVDTVLKRAEVRWSSRRAR